MNVCAIYSLGTTVKLFATRSWLVLKNGDLLSAAEAASFDVLVTLDQSIPEQQNLQDRKIALIILSGTTNRLHDLLPLIPAVLAVLGSIRPGQVERISPRLADA